ncbi:MAG TPA: ABC transporter ATP-binding protein [Phycisphaerae bacterium]|nr:ABC transporter ATP-binding protein [Phycisphaerae bacterium]
MGNAARLSGNGTALLEVRDLHVRFGLPGRLAGRCVRAVDGVSFDVHQRRTLGLVGESGCGKTTLARAILRLVPVHEGRVRFDGADVLALNARGLRRLRRRMQVVFQDSAGSLNPRMTIEGIIGEGLTVHGLARGRRRRERVATLLERVGLAADHLDRYPHEFSGGQRQRIGIARALALEPAFIVCDEPVSALDVSVQAQILNLLADLQAERGLSYLFIAHNLAVVEQFADQVAVMYLGRIVEIAAREELYARPRHPYTQSLLAAVPEPVPCRKRPALLGGEPPSPIDPPAGCSFHPRCPLAAEECRQRKPALVAKPGLAAAHLIACHLADRAADFGPSRTVSRG